MNIRVYTLGCKVNQYESQAIKEQFKELGHRYGPGPVDVCIVNTCTVTSRSDSKSRQLIMRIKRDHPQAKIAVTGCMARDSQDLLRAMSVDYIIPQEEKASLVDTVLGLGENKKDIWSLGISGFSNQRAFLKIQDGCNNRCAFCKVPWVRGNSISRSKKDILDEVKRLSPTHKEIVLCGINLGLYGADLDRSTNLCGLLREILALPTLGRIRLSSLEPYLIDGDLISVFRDPKMCHHLHLPFQSGDDAVLAAMNKKETVLLYNEIAKKLREIDPFFAISCDIIIGLPGESEQSFKKTYEFLERVRPMRTHIFSFSPRESTSLSHEKKLRQKDLKPRFLAIHSLAQRLSLDYQMSLLGRIYTIACEERQEGYTCGYTENYIKVFAAGELRMGELARVRLQRVEQGKVYGQSIC